MAVLAYVYIVLVTVLDLVSALLYAGGDAGPEALGLLRNLRDGMAVLLCLSGLAQAPWKERAVIAALVYTAFICAYLLVGSTEIDGSVLVTSAVKLAIPPVLLLAGMGALRDQAALRGFASLFALLCCLSVLFGAWDIGHTEFWTDAAEYGHYLHDIKGVLNGYNELYVLPFNFFGFEQMRRAAGLVAAPLAQGSLLATGAMLGFALFRSSRLPLALAVLALCGFGVWQSGTRGAMLILVLALPIHLLAGWRGVGGLARNLAILGVAGLLTWQSLAYVYGYTAGYEDGSTMGHVDALQQNLDGIGAALIAGKGLGTAGAVAADAGLAVAGGGESALFSVIYQLGVPAGAAFLAFYLLVAMAAWRRRHLAGAVGELALATFALVVGAATSLLLSEHLISLSAMAGFWIMVGGILAQPLDQFPRRAAPRAPWPPPQWRQHDPIECDHALDQFPRRAPPP